MSLIKMPTCLGTGLVALDVVISGKPDIPAQFLAGGSCGNVLTILSYLGWSSYPIARLSNNVAAELLLEDLHRWNVRDELLTVNETGSTPVIIHRILKDQLGLAKHRFEFRNPEDGKHLPAYKPWLARDVEAIFQQKPEASVFYFDRINRGAIELAKLYKNQGAIIFFEPSNMKDEKAFNECLAVADVIKFSDDRMPDYEKTYPVGKAPLEIQTMGTKGLKYRMENQEKWISITGYLIDDVVDAAGAGDWCTAGIISNLFRSKTMGEITSEEIHFALNFGQALSALNCTYEGARGLMYHVKRSELLLYVQHIVSSNNKLILQRKVVDLPNVKTEQIKISSLFARV